MTFVQILQGNAWQFREAESKLINDEVSKTSSFSHSENNTQK